MEQKSINLGNIEVPIVIDEGKEWFPVSYITTKVLKRSGKNSLLTKKRKGEFKNHLKVFSVRFGESNIQETNCIDKIGLIKLLERTKVGHLTIYQRMSQNNLHEYLGIDLLTTERMETKYFKDEWLDGMDDYTRDVVNEEVKVNNVEDFRMCTKCEKHYPLTNRFFAIDDRADKGFGRVCHICSGKRKYFTHPNKDKNKLRDTDFDLYKAMNDGYIEKIYEAYRSGKLKRLPDSYKNKDSYLKIIRYLYKNKELNKNNLTYKNIVNNFSLDLHAIKLSMKDVYQCLFGNNFYYRPWKYPQWRFKDVELTYELANDIIDIYIKEHKINIENIFDYDYLPLFKKCKVATLAQKDLLYFIVQYYKFEYAGYLFKSYAVNYYKKENNVLFDLKYLIEKDMKIPIEKIPLYLTKHTLHINCQSLYNIIITKKNGSIYEWVNKLYPDKFIELDFNKGAYKDEFGSHEEYLINELLKENFHKKVIYNQIHTERTIEINAMIPDWFLFTENGIYIVEYFGLYIPSSYGKNSRVTAYIDKTHEKIERYKRLSGYNFLFFYPEDVEHDYKGCREKIQKIKENLMFSML